jgi:hypothetical protein
MSTARYILVRMGKKTVYVREDDQQVWEWAERYARERRMPVSGLIMAALERYKEQEEGSK